MKAHPRSASSGKPGFTLIELLIVIGILGILAGMVLVAVDPAKRLKDARDARRKSEVNSILNAVLIYVVDNQGSYPTAIDAVATNSQIIGTSATTCQSQFHATGTTLCGEATGGETLPACADVGASLVEGFIAQMPIDPRGVDVNVATGTYDAARTGYWINKTAAGRIQVGSCNHEGPDIIKLTR
jgi:prepilin-type N-terminal cleavage/methylation domain-containing protein